MDEKKYLNSDGLVRLIENIINKFAAKNHNHDECYYTESEVDSKISDTQSSIDALSSTVETKVQFVTWESGD